MLPPAKPANQNRLAWVELGRGLAALAVVLYHASGMMNLPQYSGHIFIEAWTFWGFLGVDFFFVLSGFIILHVHFQDIGKSQRALRYGWRRLTRIFPTYWLVLALGLVVNQLLQSDKVPLTASWLANEGLLLPGFEPWLGPAWTLRYELTFYALFSVLLFNRRAGWLVLAAWFLMILGVNRHLPNQSTGAEVWSAWSVFTSPYNLDFFMGMSLAWARRTGNNLPKITAVFAALGAGFVVWSLRYGIDWFSAVRYPCCGFVCAALLGCLLMIDRRGWTLPKAFTLLGSVSYSLYLSHTISIGVFLASLAHLGLYRSIPEIAVYLGAIAAALVFAYGIYRFVEVPILDWARTKFN
jgi:exopolysaccharide production protein ExoZ